MEATWHRHIGRNFFIYPCPPRGSSKAQVRRSKKRLCVEPKYVASLHDGSCGTDPLQVQGVKSPQPKAFYSLPISKPPVQGALYLMALVNLQVVQRSWGLFELATRNPRVVLGTPRQSHGEHEDTTQLSYGSQFKYEEFLALPSRLHSLLVVLFLVMVGGAMRLFPPVRVIIFRLLGESTDAEMVQVRWVARRLMPQSGDGPTEGYVSSSWRK